MAEAFIYDAVRTPRGRGSLPWRAFGSASLWIWIWIWISFLLRERILTSL
jgi:hypothetical protein